MVMLALVVVFFAASRRSEERRLELELKSQADALRSAIEKSLKVYVKLTESVASYYMSDSTVTSTDFSHFTAPLLSHHSGVQSLGWHPRVDDAERAKFEEAARRHGIRGFEIEEVDPNGRMIRAVRRNVYFPARQLEPHKANEALLGFDLASDPVTLEAVKQARDTGRPVMSGPVRFLQEAGQDAVFILAPAYRLAASPVSLEQRRQDFMGVAAWLVRVSDVVENAVTGVVPDGIELRIEDNSAGNEVLLYASGPAPTNSAASALRLESEQHLGGRNWKLTFYPTQQYVLAQRGWLAWAFLIVGLLFTSL